MRRKALALAVLAGMAVAAGHGSAPAGPPQGAPAAATPIFHALQVTLEPGTHRLAVSASVAVPEGRTEFLLNARLAILRASAPVEEVPLGDTRPFFGINAEPGASPSTAPLKRYRIRGAPGPLTLEYAGPMDFGLSDEREQYTRGFRQTAGIVSAEGVYLSGSSFWHPYFGEDLVTFEMTVIQPRGWHVISQGSGTSRDEQGRARWTSREPMDEIYLVGGPLLVYRDSVAPPVASGFSTAEASAKAVGRTAPVASGFSRTELRTEPATIDTFVYLREKDDALASRYLATTAQYLEMYAKLIGPYPYDKFALVENFWETGYGMPSFTLLGREVIRLPFILHSSYPHEILHNWWGNSVFVDYGTGNWAEGLTAYLADHLVQEQRRRGPDYRRAALQKYRAYVRDGRDFALTDFRSRDSAATEAVGYGKTMMTFHMLRQRLGDDRFTEMLRALYREHQGTRASWRDVERAARAAAGGGLDRFFAQWTTRAGAPAIEVRDVRVGDGERHIVTGTLAQTQDGPAYGLDVPLVLQTARGAVTHRVAMTGATATFEIPADDTPLMLHVDPYFDLFRRIDPRETPPSISQLFGEPRIVAVLPSGESSERLAAYRALLKGWETPAHQIDVRLDSEVGSLPQGSSVWIVGRENGLVPSLFARQPGIRYGVEPVRFDGQDVPAANHTAVALVRHPAKADSVVGWLFADPIEALPGLGRKLPHYGRYSYVAFAGTEPENIFSGEWRTSDSPLRVDVRRPQDRGRAIAALPPDPAKALADLPPIFSRTTMMETVERLAAPAMEGRGVGTKGLADAAAFIAERFKSYGLLPGGDGGGYFQRFTLPSGPDGKPHELVNVVGYLPGTRADWKGQSAVVGAHYDHLGRGWPDARAGEEGKVHAGADDNASGVAVLLELARAMAAGDRPSRNVVFLAFSGEEARLAGSRHFVASPTPFPLDGVIGMINLDTVGRLFDGRVSVIAAGTATEWPHIFRGASFVTGVESRSIPEALESSDHAPFIERGIPAVQLFTGAHADYHRSGDTPDKIDGEGLVKVALLAREAVAYLAERPDPLTGVRPGSDQGQTGVRPGSDPGQTPSQDVRRASLGTVPDFAYPGPGVRAEGITDGSPAARAGLQPGDVILKLGDQPVADLKDYSNVLRTLKPGDTVAVLLRRGDKEFTVQVTLAER